ncbi:hypothetical protein [Clostridium acetobutylicum]|nr:hypothetical protein [Clostridium acetobutylicum]NRY57982.1 hypothetical protein [Clostridium acetobutylicum]
MFIGKIEIYIKKSNEIYAKNLFEYIIETIKIIFIIRTAIGGSYV